MAEFLVTYRLPGEGSRRTAQVVDNLVPAAIVASAFARKHHADVIRCQLIGGAAQVVAPEARLWERKKAAVG